MSKIDRERLVDLYESTKSITKIADELNCSVSTVRRRMKKFGIEYETTSRLYSINKDFFSSINVGEIQLYWAGFLAANGTISHHSGSKNSTKGIQKAYRIFVNVPVVDKQYLEQLRNTIGSNAPVKTETVGPADKLYTRASLIISSKDLVEDLVRFNIVPDKKRTFVLPDWLFNNKDIRHFLRGWVDGLGGFYYQDNSKIFRTSGTVIFLNQLKELMIKNLTLETNRPIITSLNRNSITYYNQTDVAAIAHWLYDDSHHFFNRKKEIAILR